MGRPMWPPYMPRLTPHLQPQIFGIPVGLRDLILGSPVLDWLVLDLSEPASGRSSCWGALCCFLAFWNREAPSTTVCTASVAPPISCSTSVTALSPPAACQVPARGVQLSLMLWRIQSRAGDALCDLIQAHCGIHCGLNLGMQACAWARVYCRRIQGLTQASSEFCGKLRGSVHGYC